MTANFTDWGGDLRNQGALLPLPRYHTGYGHYRERYVKCPDGK